jgi:hypothetical protein
MSPIIEFTSATSAVGFVFSNTSSASPLGHTMRQPPPPRLRPRGGAGFVFSESSNESLSGAKSNTYL